MNWKFVVIINTLLVLSLTACSGIEPKNTRTVEALSSSVHKTKGLPFSEAVRVGNMLYLSGQIGAKPDGSGLVSGGIQAETQQILENIQGVLTRYNSALNRVAKCTVFLADMSEWQAMNKVYTKVFVDHLPARSAVGVNGIALGARVEIECIAALN